MSAFNFILREAVTAVDEILVDHTPANQIPIGTPIALLFIATALLFLPSILGSGGEPIFGTTEQDLQPGTDVVGLIHHHHMMDSLLA